MKVEITNQHKPERKIMAFINSTGELILRNQYNSKNTILGKRGQTQAGNYDFDEYSKMITKSLTIYEGDSITITF